MEMERFKMSPSIIIGEANLRNWWRNSCFDGSNVIVYLMMKMRSYLLIQIRM